MISRRHSFLFALGTKNTFLCIVSAAIVFAGCTSQRNAAPVASEGVLDLRQWDFENDGEVNLSGEYEFYWQRHLPTTSFVNDQPIADGYIKVPGRWNGFDVDGRPLPGIGYATYRLTVLLPDILPALALKFLDMATAFTVFVNGENILTIGNPGHDAATTTPRYLPQVVDLGAPGRRMEIIFHVSNFHHDKGGAWEVIRLGAKSRMHFAREQRLAFDLILFGSILIMACYHFFLFALRRSNRSTLYFGLFCFLNAVRLLTTVEKYLMHFFPAIPWEVAVKIEYLSYYLSVAAFALFMHSLFKQDFHKPVLVAATGIPTFFSAIVVFTPALFFTKMLVAFHFFNLTAAAYAIGLTVICVVRKRNGALIFLAGFLCVTACLINDVLDANGMIQTGHFMQFGLFAFIFSQSLLLSKFFSSAFDTVEMQRHELAKAYQNLQHEIAERQHAEQEKKELREKLARAQKMEALGLLAGGVAHDLNNVLSGIVSYPDLLLLDLPPSNPFHEPLTSIKDAGLRAAAIVQDLLAMARRGLSQELVINLNEVVRDYLNSTTWMELRLNQRGLKAQTNLEANLFNIKGDHNHLNKIIMNLIANATEAKTGDGELIITTSNRYLDVPYRGYENIAEGSYAVLSIQDHGVGISSDDLKKIFEPFYTKKVMGRSGTGLGLAIVWNTVHDHQGYIDIVSEVGQGTRIDLYFNITMEELAQEGHPIELEYFRGRNEKILVVDDVREQREIAQRILKRLGYSVTLADSGEAAIRCIQNSEIDLVVLDMIMEPGIDGLETYQRLRAVRAEIKAVIVSGYAETDRVRKALSLGAGRYIRKPYTIENIGIAIRAELDKPLPRIEEAVISMITGK